MITRAVLLVIAAGVAFGLLRLLYGQRPATCTFVGRRRSMRRRARGPGAHLQPDARRMREGMTWGYYVTDGSSANLRASRRERAVEDTHNIHRTAFRIWRTAPRGDYLGTRPAWIASTLELLIPGCLGLGAIMLAVGAVKAWRGRRMHPTPAVS